MVVGQNDDLKVDARGLIGGFCEELVQDGDGVGEDKWLEVRESKKISERLLTNL